MSDELKGLIKGLHACADDPMWADHAEVPKVLCARAAAALERLSAERDEAVSHAIDVEAALSIALGDRDEERARAEQAEAERDALKTVMIAAAEEIHAHWDAHCDADGYGPANLMRRLEDGIPSQYGYTAGRFTELLAERDALRAEVADALHAMRDYARENPRHEYQGVTQDPNGVHAWLARNDAARGGEKQA